MHIAIVEDNAQEQERLAALVRQHFEQQQKPCTVACYADGDELLAQYRPTWDIILLDIQLERLDGITTAEMIRRQDADVFLIFVTNMASYAIRGYSVRALDFLLKPVNERVLRQVLLQAERLCAQRERRTITLPTQSGITRIAVDEIDYVEVVSHVLSVVTQKGVIRLRGTISGIEKMLADADFFRCNNCYLVNLSHVRAVEQSIVTVGAHQLTISRPRQKKFMEALTRYVGGSQSHD